MEILAPTRQWQIRSVEHIVGLMIILHARIQINRFVTYLMGKHAPIVQVKEHSARPTIVKLVYKIMVSFAKIKGINHGV